MICEKRIFDHEIGVLQVIYAHAGISFIMRKAGLVRFIPGKRLRKIALINLFHRRLIFVNEIKQNVVAM